MPSSASDPLSTPIEGLLATSTTRLPYQRNVLLRSFLLERADGNVIVYNSPGIGAAAADIRGHGGATRLLINHAHESMYGEPDLEVGVWVHERDRDEIAAAMPVAGAFTERRMLDDDLEVIPTPGHTAGTTSYLWDSGTHRFLFTGDFLWIEDGEWKAVVLDSGLRSAYLDSLALVRELDFDVLVPWGTSEGGQCFAQVDRDEMVERVDAIIDRVGSGGSR